MRSIAKKIKENVETDTRIQFGRERSHRIARMEDLHVKVAAVEEIVSAHVTAEQASRDAHAIMIATDAARRAMNARGPLADEVAALREAGNQPIIRAAVDTIPDVVLQHGTCSQQYVTTVRLLVVTVYGAVKHANRMGRFISVSYS